MWAVYYASKSGKAERDAADRAEPGISGPAKDR
jgi:hypothetical protein